MKIYFILWLILVFNIFLETEFMNIKLFNYIIKSRNVSFIVCFISILSLGISRHEDLGVDIFNYKYYFSIIYPNHNLRYFLGNSIYDPGYVILNKIVSLYTDNFKIFEVIVFCITFGIFSLIIYKESKYPALSFLIYTGFGFIGFNMCILRQAIACALCFLAYYFLEKNKRFNYFIVVLIAISFHKTAIFFYLTYLLSYNRKKELSLKSHISNIILSIIGFSLFMPKVFDFYSNDYSEAAIKGQGIKLLLVYILISVIIGIVLKQNKSKEGIMKYESSLGAIYVQIGALSFSLFTRITNYFSMLFTLSIPNIIHTSKYRKIYIFIYSVIFSALFIYGIFNDGYRIVPYKSFM